MQPDGIALGVVSPADCRTRTMRLNAGDRLLLFTDGITEAHDPKGDLFEDERLHATVAGRGHLDAHQLVEGIFEDVHAFAAGAPQHDDLTCLALAYRGAASGS
jgi:sigma-B regulation protein RsbU (phosphoserine phosphatase)